MEKYNPPSQVYRAYLRMGYFYYGLGYLEAPPLGGGILMGYGVWRFAGGTWTLIKDASDPDCESSPPIERGTFEGEIVRTPAQPKPRR